MNCEMCGKEDKTQEEIEIELREEANKDAISFKVGRESVRILSTRENEIIDSVIGLGMSFEETAENYGISYDAVKMAWYRAMVKIKGLR